jgi:phage regulator Rha-like protein
MTTAIVTIEVRSDRLVVDSRLVAQGLDINHKSFLDTVRKYKSLIQQRFGVLAFETAKLPEGSQGGRPEKFAWLTEDQAIFLMTLSRNTDQVVECKASLVEAFKNARESQPSIPQSYAQALLEAGRIALELEKAQAEKALLEEQNELLAEAVDELFDYSSIIRIAKFNDVNETRFKWQTLKAMSRKMGYEIKQVPCPRFEYKNLYAHDVWRVCYPDMEMPETTTLVINKN